MFDDTGGYTLYYIRYCYINYIRLIMGIFYNLLALRSFQTPPKRILFVYRDQAFTAEESTGYVTCGDWTFHDIPSKLSQKTLEKITIVLMGNSLVLWPFSKAICESLQDGNACKFVIYMAISNNSLICLFFPSGTLHMFNVRGTTSGGTTIGLKATSNTRTQISGM